VPVECIEQIHAICDFDTWPEVFVCCSGTFRIEESIRIRHPSKQLTGNDVSALSCALGWYFTDQWDRLESFHFKGRFEFVEPLCKTGLDRVAAILVAQEMTLFKGDNPYHRAHWDYYERNFESFMDRAGVKLAERHDLVGLNRFEPRDWLLHVDEAIERGAGIAAFPQFYKAGYEKLYKLLNDSLEWPAPAYTIFDPKTLPDIMRRIDDSGVPYFVIAEQLIPGLEPQMQFEQGRHVPHYGYAKGLRSSWRQIGTLAKPFRYTPIDVRRLSPKTRVRITKAEQHNANWIKDIYLSKSIRHVTGECAFFVWLDDMLAGCLIYSRPKFGGADSDWAYLLIDVATTRDGRISKLIASLATSQEIAQILSRQFWSHVHNLATSAFTPRPSSMKYRGTWTLASRKPDPMRPGQNVINYHAKVSPKSLRALYIEWWNRNHQNLAQRVANDD
jgi:hypothetical protein